VQSTQRNILLRGLSEEAEGEILQGDALVAIDKDDCSHWPMSRVKARVSKRYQMLTYLKNCNSVTVYIFDLSFLNTRYVFICFALDLQFNVT